MLLQRSGLLFFFTYRLVDQKTGSFFLEETGLFVRLSVKNMFMKEEAFKSNLRRKYLLHLLNEPQYLAKIRTPKLLKISNKRVTILCKRKLKKQLTKTPRKRNEKYAKNVLVSFPMSRLEFLEMIGN